jgi:hypothetical protein
MATKNKLPRSTPGWICGRITEEFVIARPAPPGAAIQRDRFVASILNSAVG